MIGYADSADGTGINTTPNTIELKYTLGGDLNLAGTVNFNDFALVVASYGKPASWDAGAITYDATVSFADFALTVANFGKQVVTSSALAAAGVDAAGRPVADDPATGSSAKPFLPAVNSRGSTEPVVHHPRPSHASMRKRR